MDYLKAYIARIYTAKILARVTTEQCLTIIICIGVTHQITPLLQPIFWESGNILTY